MALTTIRELYGIETDGTDWPQGMSEGEKTALVDAVRTVLKRNPQGLESWLIERQPEVREALGVALFWDWRFGAITRACRALSAEQRWVLK